MLPRTPQGVPVMYRGIRFCGLTMRTNNSAKMSVYAIIATIRKARRSHARVTCDALIRGADGLTGVAACSEVEIDELPAAAGAEDDDRQEHADGGRIAHQERTHFEDLDF